MPSSRHKMKDYFATPPKITNRRLFTISAPAADAKRSLQIKTILVPVDFSQESLRVLEYSTLVAESFGAATHVIHVRPPKEAFAIERAGNLLLNYADAIGFLQDRLAEIQEKHGVKFSPDNCHVEAGRPFEEIYETARKTDADLIVMATRGESGLKRLLLGSTTERVIRFAPCPVFIPRGKSYKAALAGDRKSALKIRKILVPVDFSDCSLAGVGYAAFLGRHFDARLKLLHVVVPYNYVFASNGFESETTRLTEVAQASAKKQMTELRRSNLLRGVSCEVEIPTGNTIDEICRQGTNSDVDLIVISTHGRSGFRHALMGSVAEHVARYAECPVLVVPSRGGS
jgi:nucleotide-binding universal stress UspA family protein